MKFPCEKVANTILPAIRAEIAFKLSNEYGLKQMEISKILGVTQGAVSHYLTSFRGKERETVNKNPKIMEKIDEIAYMLVRGKFDEKNFCEICREIRRLSSSDI
ncbi:MAG TPA: transcriptional regulator [Thermoplasmatales archaeon]|nr:transcriptional regulator [Thermoplasmatales archaeon]